MVGLITGTHYLTAAGGLERNTILPEAPKIHNSIGNTLAIRQECLLDESDPILSPTVAEDFGSVVAMQKVQDYLNVSREENASDSLYQCGTCYQRFSHSCSLSRHKRSCKKVVLIPCDLCDKTFSRIDNLKVHIKLKHGLGPSLDCSLCGARFRSKVRLEEHETVCETRSGQNIWENTDLYPK